MSLGGGGSRQELQELSSEIQALEEEREGLETELEGLRAQKLDIDDAIEALENLETGSIVQVPLGGGAFVRAEVQDVDEAIVNLGGGYAAERDQEGAVESLESKKDMIDDRIDEVNEQIREVEAESEQLEQRAQQVQQQALQQQMGGQGGLGGEGDEGDGE